MTTCLRLWTYVLFALLTPTQSVSTKLHANPIRKVVNLLMAMQKKVEAEGKQSTELFDKSMCDVKKFMAGLDKSIADSSERLPQLESSIKETSAEHQQLAEDLKQAQEDRSSAEKAVATANSIRTKSAAEFAKESASQTADITAVTKAIKAIQGGQGAFLQTKASAVLRRLVGASSVDLSSVDRDLLSNYLQGGEQEPSSGEILGIMKQMHEELSKDLADMVADEDGAVADHESLVTAKKKEIKANTKAIEVKTGRKGELAVELTKLKNDLDDTKESLAEDGQFLATTKTTAQVKEQEFEAYKKVQSHELVCLADTIKLLNDDDALDLFKKTLPSPGAAVFLQMPVTNKRMKHDALKVLRGARRRGHKKGHFDPRLDLLALWVQGRKGGSFKEVLAKIDRLMANLKKEQADDEVKKTWCIAEVDKTEEEVKWTARTVGDVEKVIGSAKEDLKAILAEIASVTAGIKELDQTVTQATKQRKEEHASNNNVMAENGAAKQLIEMAKKRMSRFYNPKLVEPEGKAFVQKVVYDSDLVDRNGADDEDNAPSFVQVRAHSQVDDESLLGEVSDSDGEEQEVSSESEDEEVAKPHKKQNEGNGGVMEMLSILKEDLSKQILEIELEEKEGQKDYEIFMKDSSAKRAIDSKAVADKEASKAKIETELQKAKGKLNGEQGSLAESQQELGELHGECDWFIKNFDTRKSARADEGDALSKARAVMSGADYS